MSPRPLLALAFVLGALGGCFLTPNVPPSFRYSCNADADCRVLTCRGDLIAIAEADARGLQPAPESCAKLPEDEQTLYYEARQTCINGLCEYPCEITAAACPAEKGYNLCLNGACATACGQDPERYPDPDSTCSSPQRCLIFGEDIELDLLKSLYSGGRGGSSGGGIPGLGGGGGSSNELESLVGTGVCGVRCDAEGALACPPGQYCSGAMCLADCLHPDATPCAADQTCFAFGQVAVCMDRCEPSDPDSCGEGQVCVAGLDVCRPSCVGENATVCDDGFVCNEALKVCVPEVLDPGPDADTDADTDAGTDTDS